MTANQKIRNTCFVIEGLNSFATILFFNYLYFFMRDRFGFGDRANLAFAALLGLIYTFAAWQGGKFAHRFGYEEMPVVHGVERAAEDSEAQL